MKKDVLILGIESSCDETSVAIIKNGREVLSNIISSQIEVHKLFGGVVPEIASRHHLTNINKVVDKTFEEAGVKWDDIDAIAVTCGPGLVGALVIGIATAKAYALAQNKKLIGVHHIQGHISANYLAHKDLKPPFLSLVASGGHTSIIEVKDYTDFKVIGQTRDDAVGEAFDKVARVLELGYPGGPLIDKLAEDGDENAVLFKRVYLEKGSYDFSFSGIKTGVLNHINKEKMAGREINKADIAASFQQAVMEVVVNKTIDAAKELKLNKIAIAGGVASNSLIRKMMEERCREENIEFYYPEPVLCTDNGAMIGAAGYFKYIKGEFSNLLLDGYPNLDIMAKV